MSSEANPLGLRGIEFTEFVMEDAAYAHRIFTALGFSRLKKHPEQEIDYYRQNDIRFLLNRNPRGFARDFARQHGPSICSMGWRVDDSRAALAQAVARGAEPARGSADLPYPALQGIGGSLIYLIDYAKLDAAPYRSDFVDHPAPVRVPSRGFRVIDHLTNNVYQGTLDTWAQFYKGVFGFTEVRHFDIDGQETGLLSYALRSPDGSFCIPINEGKGQTNNQIDEYLQRYQGPGVQHLALRSDDLLASLDALAGQIDMLDIAPSYYATVFDRVPGVREAPERIRQHRVLVDGDPRGYLLQIFTKDLFGPIFFEMIQRVDHKGFGEGNFQALFEAIERDQKRRGVL